MQRCPVQPGPPPTQQGHPTPQVTGTFLKGSRENPSFPGPRAPQGPGRPESPSQWVLELDWVWGPLSALRPWPPTSFVWQLGHSGRAQSQPPPPQGGWHPRHLFHPMYGQETAQVHEGPPGWPRGFLIGDRGTVWTGSMGTPPPGSDPGPREEAGRAGQAQPMPNPG